MYDEVTAIVLTDGREIRVDADYDTPLSDASSPLSIVVNGEAAEIDVDVDRYGWGGGYIFLSPSEKYLVLAYYTGASSEIFSLFKIGDSLEQIFELYNDGEAGDYCFSPDEKQLIQVLPYSCSYWWGAWDEHHHLFKANHYDEMEKDKTGRLFFDFGLVNILDIDNKEVSKHTIRIYPPENWQPPSEDDYYDPMTRPQIIGDALHVHMPWGKEAFSLPLKEIIAIEVK
ncbi:MAG: hypothetical protein LBV04_08640 [Deferribacteraceae bacterium]|jgi:hypothetical protein|nr:hypothetical protein [Deferribacteraceae bacterium]